MDMGLDIEVSLHEADGLDADDQQARIRALLASTATFHSSMSVTCTK